MSNHSEDKMMVKKKLFGKCFRHLILTQLLLVCLGQVFSQSSLGLWKQVTPGKFRDHNAMIMLSDERWIAVGGNETNDPITSIFITENSGQSWEIIEDAVNAQLTDIEFVDNLRGVAVGWNGTVRRTDDGGNTWDKILEQESLVGRNLNAVTSVNGNCIFTVGGLADSLMTLAWSKDYGQLWNSVVDTVGNVLNDIMFDGDLGIAVGDHGVVLVSDDGGVSWNQSIVDTEEDVLLRAITFTPNSILIAGGYHSNDSTYCIYQSLDAGGSWNLVASGEGGELFDIEPVSDESVLAVGGEGLILKSDGNLSSWLKYELPDTLEDERDLKFIHFTNEYFGVICGEQGKILLFNDSTILAPEVESLNILPLGQNSVTIVSKINPNGLETTIKFLYGSSADLENSVQYDTVLNGDDYVEVQMDLSDLERNKDLYFSLEATSEAGSVLGPLKSVVLADNFIPNWSFENWDSTLSISPSNWESFGSITAVPRGLSSTAIQMQGNEKDPGAIILGAVNDNGLTGGIPFELRPDTLSVYMKFDIAASDSAQVILQLKSHSGEKVVDAIYTLGGRQDSYKLFKFPIDYDSELKVDSLLLAFTSTNVFDEPDPKSVMIVDSVHFQTSASYDIPNADFEEIDTSVIEILQAWSSQGGLETFGKSTFSQHGEYSLELRSANVIVGTGNINDSSPSFPVSREFESLSGYYNLQGFSGDSLEVSINLYHDGAETANGVGKYGPTGSSFELFRVEIFDFDGQVLADSASISMRLDSNTSNQSIVTIDNLHFESVISRATNITSHNISLFPNPSENILNIRLPQLAEGFQEYSVIDNLGVKMFDGFLSPIQSQIHISDLLTGYYFLQIHSDLRSITLPFIKK